MKKQSLIWVGICCLLALASCATSPLKEQEPIKVPVPIPCVSLTEKPAIPKTALTAATLAAAEDAVTTLAKPPPEIPKAKLAELVGAIDRLVTVLMIDLLQLKDYMIHADVLLTGCIKEQKQ